MSADGSETAARVQLNKALLGFLSHTGYAHGGNGFGGVAFLLERFADQPLDDPGAADHGLDLGAMAANYAGEYCAVRIAARESGAARSNIPCINHPVFKDKPVNVDPREAFIRELMLKRGETNAFHAYYRELVQALADAGKTRNVFCVNVDALIATLLLKLMWRPWRAGEVDAGALETAVFTIFLYGRMIGSVA